MPSDPIGTPVEPLAPALQVGMRINFEKAKKLPNTGRTCDVYEYRYMSKRFLVKRIREEYRGMPAIHKLFAKEYEVGLNLGHPGLPVYRYNGPDYIVMDYVDGKTLLKMIAEKDPWLADAANLRHMLMQLVDVIDYLHQKNVVHCDVKCDNVMITAGTRNVMLIDLGEAYTYALDELSGDPRVYGLDLRKDKGSPDIDFHGVGMIVDRLKRAGFPCRKLARFRRLCDRRGVTPARLQAALRPRRTVPLAAAAIFAAAIAALAVILLVRPEPEPPVATPPAVSAPETRPEPATAVKAAGTGSTAPGAEAETGTGNAAELPAHKEPKPEMRTKPTPEEIAGAVRRLLAPAINSLKPQLDRLEALIGNESLTATQLLEAETDFAEIETETISQAMREFRALYPGLELADVHQSFYGSDIYSDYIRRSNRIQQAVAEEFKRRNH